jgi:hypothetical protein
MLRRFADNVATSREGSRVSITFHFDH